jgi:FERM/RhoGEF/pleckstrin domain protein 2
MHESCFLLLFCNFYSICTVQNLSKTFPLPDYHGINGSLDRRSDLTSPIMNRYDLTMGSDRSMSYDLAEAEKNNQNNLIGIITASSPTSIGITQTNSIVNTLERSDTLRKKWPTDKAYYISKEILMTERTYRRDLDVINLVSWFEPGR